MEKNCSNCGELKPHTEYQKRAMSKDGLTSSCKSCLKERDARRFKNDPRVRDRHKKYRETEAGKESVDRARKKWLAENKDERKRSIADYNARNPEKRAARVILGNAVRDGRVDKPKDCVCCGSTPTILHGHHEDYTQPVNVVWCCPPCHAGIHKGEIDIEIVDGKFTPT